MAKDLEISVARVGRIATNKEWKMWCPKGKPANDRPLFAKLAKNTATSDWQPGSIWWHERHVLCVLPSHNLYHTNACKIWGKASRFPNCPMIELSHKAMFEIVMSYTTIHRSSTTLLHYFRCRVEQLLTFNSSHLKIGKIARRKSSSSSPIIFQDLS